MAENGSNGKLRSRKFILAAASMMLTYAALFGGKLDGGETVALVSLILGIFAGGNVVAKHKSFNEGA
jgi:hypothetical protein